MIVEHRKYLRVDDRLVLSWRPADNDHIEVDDLRDLMLMTVNREINQMIASLGDHSADVAQILLHLNHKIDLLTDQRSENHYGPSLTRINVSRSGLAFEWRSAITLGSIIRVSMALPPDNTKVTLSAQILACDDFGANRSRVRCRFLPGQDDRIDQIGRYVDHMHQTREHRSRLKAPLSDDIINLRDYDSARSSEPALVDYR